MEKAYILLVVLIVLIAITALQAVQLNALAVKISSGVVSTGTGSGQATGQSNVPASLQNLPNMVGGC